jgi:hypothetical protein
MSAAAFLYEYHGAQVGAVPFAGGVDRNAGGKSRRRGVNFCEW